MGMEAFPAFVEERRNGCVFRAAGGVNYRNSSVTVLDPSAFDLHWLLEQTVSFSNAHQIEPVLRVPQLWPEFEEALVAQGWELFRSCTVMDRSLAGEEREEGGSLFHVDYGRWLDFQLSSRPLKPETAQIMTEIFSMLPESAERLMWREEGEELGGALLLYDEGYCALMNMLVATSARGKGVGKRFLAGMFAHAAARGAHTMWLQVLLDNAPAVSTYRRAGLKTVYEYSYYRESA